MFKISIEMTRRFRVLAPSALALAISAAGLLASVLADDQSEPVDPTRQVASPAFQVDRHRAVWEQFIWLKSKSEAGSEADRAATRYFRRAFRIDSLPSQATLYIAGPNRIRAFLNGQLVVDAGRDPKSKISPFVVAVDARAALRPGENVVAIEASQFPRSGFERFGVALPTMAAKIVPAAEGLYARPLVFTDMSWPASLDSATGWEQPRFNDSPWPLAESLGGVDDDIQRFQWNADAGMYRWPGYDGITAFLAHTSLPPAAVIEVFEGSGHFVNLESLKYPTPAAKFTVTLPAAGSAADSPSLLLDFGREVNGRLEIVSDSDAPMRVESQYGESLEEAVNSPYLGANEILVPAHETAFGPKSAFRYARVKFLGAGAELRFAAIRVDDIYYPVQYKGSFESSDPLLNRIWEVGAYTAHLCMVDGIWDAPKRDRARWMGDLHVSGRVIDTVFADILLMKESMDRLIALTGQPSGRHVNTIPGYSAFWVLGEADFYRHQGDRAYLRKIHDPLLGLLNYMSRELDENYLFANASKSWPFVDWSPELSGDTPEARAATQFEFYGAFSDGAWLLREAGDSSNAAKYESLAAELKTAAQAKLRNSPFNTFGTRWQTNAAAIFFGIADANETAAIWSSVLAQPPRQIISPYYNFYAIKAMAASGHRTEALDWIRKYWGGMIAEGATSFWEAYDPSWPKEDFHRHLQADNSSGYFVSLSHGWASGPTAWLAEEILGIEPSAAGFNRVTIRPDLAGLEWARGSEPTPHGLISVDVRNAGGFTATIVLPSGVEALVSVPAPSAGNSISFNGKPITGTSDESATRIRFPLRGPGKFRIESH